MNDTCGCPFGKMTVKELSALDKNELVSLATKIIPAYLESGKYEEIIGIAALSLSPIEMKKILEDDEQELALGTNEPFKNLRATVNAIRISLRQMIKGEPYKCSLETIEALSIVASKHSKKGLDYWTDELLKTLSEEKKLGGQISSWVSCFEEIKKLIEVFNLPEENVKEIFRKVLKENEKLEDPSFWINNFSKIDDIIKTLDLSKEAMEMFKGIIERNKEKNPDTCTEIAVKTGISINPQEFLEIADGFLKKANNEKYNWRRTFASTACRTYKNLEKECQLGSRKKILEIYNKGTSDRNINKIIWMGGNKVIENDGFEYKKQKFWDIHIGW